MRRGSRSPLPHLAAQLHHQTGELENSQIPTFQSFPRIPFINWLGRLIPALVQRVLLPACVRAPRICPHPLSLCPSRFRWVPGLTHHVMTRVSCNWVWAQMTETWAYLDLNTWVGIGSIRTAWREVRRATGPPGPLSVLQDRCLVLADTAGHAPFPTQGSTEQ